MGKRNRDYRMKGARLIKTSLLIVECAMMAEEYSAAGIGEDIDGISRTSVDSTMPGKAQTTMLQF